MEITSLTNEKVKTWAKLKEKKYRDREHKCIVEGMHLVEEAFHAQVLDCIIVEKGFPQKNWQELPVYEVTSDIMRKLTTVVSSEKIIGIIHMEVAQEVQGERLILLDNVQDPGNAGTILRSAYAFGYDGVIFSNTSVDIFNEKVIRSSQGAMFHLPVYRKELCDIIPTLQASGCHVYVTSLRNALPLSSITPQGPFALVFGNEGQGVSDAVLSLADTSIIIEMKGFESLNVAVAASICMYTFMER